MGLNKYSSCAVAAPSSAATARFSTAHHFSHASYLLKIEFFLLGKDKKKQHKKPFF